MTTTTTKNEWESFLRHNGKVIIDMDRLQKDDKYLHIVRNLYNDDIMKSLSFWYKHRRNPCPPTPPPRAEKFIFWESQEQRYYSIFTSVELTDVKKQHKETFKILLEVLNRFESICFHCKTRMGFLPTTISCYKCRVDYCPTCFQEIRNMFFVGCGIFTCRNCRYVIDCFQ